MQQKPHQITPCFYYQTPLYCRLNLSRHNFTLLSLPFSLSTPRPWQFLLSHNSIPCASVSHLPMCTLTLQCSHSLISSPANAPSHFPARITEVRSCRIYWYNLWSMTGPSSTVESISFTIRDLYIAISIANPLQSHSIMTPAVPICGRVWNSMTTTKQQNTDT